MSLIKNMAAFKNWHLFYAERYGLLRHEFEIVHRSGLKLRLRPNTDDLKIIKSKNIRINTRVLIVLFQSLRLSSILPLLS